MTIEFPRPFLKTEKKENQMDRLCSEYRLNDFDSSLNNQSEYTTITKDGRGACPRYCVLQTPPVDYFGACCPPAASGDGSPLGLSFFFFLSFFISLLYIRHPGHISLVHENRNKYNTFHYDTDNSLPFDGLRARPRHLRGPLKDEADVVVIVFITGGPGITQHHLLLSTCPVRGKCFSPFHPTRSIRCKRETGKSHLLGWIGRRDGARQP